VGPECQCGCGEFLPSGSTRNYKRGHKPSNGQGAPRNLYAIPTQAPPQPEGGEWQTVDTGFPAQGDWEGLQGTPLEEERLTLQTAASLTPDDAPPSDFGKPIKPKFTVTKKVRDDVEGKTLFYLSMSTAMLTPLDPICFGAVQNQAPAIASKLTPILCQSPEVVKWMTKAGNFALWVDLAMAMWPVVQAIIAHHITKTIARQGERPPVDYSQYSAAA
jgi:hypothetical protein